MELGLLQRDVAERIGTHVQTVCNWELGETSPALPRLPGVIGFLGYERRATVVTTNLAFAEWVTVFAGDEKLATALLDRLAHHATVITTKGKSYRMRKRRPPGS